MFLSDEIIYKEHTDLPVLNGKPAEIVILLTE